MARNIAFSIANSPLVKTAIAGEDSNYGRIIMAIGKAGEPVQPNKIQIKFGDYLIIDHGKVSKDYNEEDLKEYMKWDSINIEVNLNIGSGVYTAYTCDFTHEYISINAEYN
jgi:glutamate N-acetyltransferase / amino-acid N-acetyltransferase